MFKVMYSSAMQRIQSPSIARSPLIFPRLHDRYPSSP
jgi:hypothetical protein